MSDTKIVQTGVNMFPLLCFQVISLHLKMQGKVIFPLGSIPEQRYDQNAVASLCL